MANNENLLNAFSLYKSKGLITPAEYELLTPYMLDAKTEPPKWVARLAEACELAENGKISPQDLALMKKDILQYVPGAPAGDQPAGAVPAEPENVRRKECVDIVRFCSIAACVLGLIPIPGLDAPFLIAVQYIMLRKICAKYGRQPGSTLVLVVIAALLGPIILNYFVKRFPYTGSIVGACVGGGFTWFVGSRVLRILEKGEQFTWENILKSVFEK